MIIDNIENASKYYGCHEGFREAFEFLHNAENTPDGSYVIVPEKVTVNISTYTNKAFADCKYESHAEKIDIQYVIDESEQIDFADSRKLEILEDNYSSGDIAFLADGEMCVSAQLEKGQFAVIYPFEAHKPCIAVGDKPVTVRKAVVKIKA